VRTPKRARRWWIKVNGLFAKASVSPRSGSPLLPGGSGFMVAIMSNPHSMPGLGVVRKCARQNRQSPVEAVPDASDWTFSVARAMLICGRNRCANSTS